jgi:hypothetical protein
MECGPIARVHTVTIDPDGSGQVEIIVGDQ